MPKLSPGSPLIQRLKLQLPESYGTPLPDLGEVGFDSAAREAMKRSFRDQGWANWGDSMQKYAGGNMVQLGAPQGDQNLGDDLYNGMLGLVQLEDPGQTVLQLVGADQLPGSWILEKGTQYIADYIADLMQDVFDALVQSVSAIPIYGWVIEMLWDVANGISRLVKIIREQDKDPEQEYPRASFGPDVDATLAGDVIRHDVLQTTDWTRLFLPRGLGFSSKKLEGGGRRIDTGMQLEEYPNIGLVPGTKKVDAGYEIYPGTYGTNARSLGMFLPSLTSFSLDLWDSINRVGPAMYCVDAYRLEMLWRHYVYDLLEYMAAGQIDTHLPEDARRWFVNTLGAHEGGSSTNTMWGTFGGIASYDSAKAIFRDLFDNKIDELDAHERLGTFETVPVKNAKLLRERQKGYLNSTVIAYVRDDYAAFQGIYPENAELKEKLEKNKQILLQHDAVCDLDVSAMPDAMYKAFVEDEQNKPHRCVPQHLGTIKMPTFRPDPEGATPPDPQVAPADGPRPPDGDDLAHEAMRTGRIPTWGILAAAVGAAWAGKKYLAKRRRG